MIQLDKLTDLNQMLKENTLVIVDFFTESCPPCKKVAPYYEKLSTQFQHIAFTKVDCGVPNDIVQTYKVGAVPTFIFFKSGKAVHTHHGANEKELKDAVLKHFQ